MTTVTIAEERLELLFGTRDENLKRIESAFGVSVTARGGQVRVEGDESSSDLVRYLLEQLSVLLESGYPLQPTDIETSIRVLQEAPTTSLVDFFKDDGVLGTVRSLVRPRSLRQQIYLQAMSDYDLVISIGPAGTGKTYLAVAMAAAALKEGLIRRIILARPAVEAGERLGFLPGDLLEKVNPYLRPLHDALYDILGFDKVARLMERGSIEVAPIAFMRGRTLNDSFIILDEEARQVLKSVKGIHFIQFTEKDVVRHRLVQKIVRAYDQYDQLKAASTPGQDSRND